MQTMARPLGLLALLVNGPAITDADTNTPKFPMYKQCDQRWGQALMGVDGPGERNTICYEGCAMSSVAMAMAGYGFTLPGEATPPTPGSLNAWLIANKGYACAAHDCNNLVLNMPDVITGGRMRIVGEWGGHCCGGNDAKPSLASMQENLKLTQMHMAYVAHVRNSSHFVLLTSWSDSLGAFGAHDPFYNTTHYAYDEISDIIMYSILPTDAMVPKAYPLFQQFDYRWGQDMIATKSIAAVGCLMSSTSMALNGHGIKISGDRSTPGTLNAWLRAHSGYTGNDFKEEALPHIDPAHISWSDAHGMHRTNDVTMAEIQESLHAGQPVIANVMNGEHFVLVVGVDKKDASNPQLYVNDPGFYRIAYNFSDVVGWRLFNMTSSGFSSSMDALPLVVV